MQAFAVQQDAARNLLVSLGMPKPDLKTLEHIRDLRVAIAGHPTLQTRPETLPRRAHFISQITLDDRGVQLQTVDGSGQPFFQDVAIPKLASEQEKYILALIRKALAFVTAPAEAAIRRPFSGGVV